MNDRIIRFQELERMLGVSRRTIGRMRQRGDLPEPIRLTKGVSGWRESTISEWLDERQAEAEERAVAQS